MVAVRVTSALPVLEERLRGTKFVALGTSSILNSPAQTGMDFWSLNPYVGCEFGCSYCYARYAHRYVVERAHDAGKLSDGEFREFRGPHGWEAFEQRIFVSLITVDAALIRKVEVRTPLPAVRLRALRRLTAAGLNAGLIVAPVLPGVTDDLPRLEALFAAARDAGARFLHAGPLRLYPGIRDRFLPVLEQHFPELAGRYRRAYARQSAAPRTYATALTRRIKRLQQRYGFPVNDGMRDRYRPRREPAQRELGL